MMPTKNNRKSEQVTSTGAGCSHYILICADADKALERAPSAYELADYRLLRGEWGLNNRTRNLHNIAPGDRVVAYASGKRKHGMTFVGTAVVVTAPSQIVSAEAGRLVSGVPNEFGEPPTYSFKITDPCIFPRPVPIRDLMERLPTVTRPDSSRWAFRLIGGTLRISPEDYHTIVDTGMQA